MPHELIDLTGKRFGRLTVLTRSDKNTNNGKPQWICRCDCGNIVTVSGVNLRRGSTKSCGCFRREYARIQHTTHGKGHSRLFRIWTGMKDRCLNPNSKYWDKYGGRGITLCKEWEHDFMSFYEWSMNNGYAENLTIDRINNDKGYEPENCRWATYKVQENNRSNNILFKVDGEILTLAELSRITGLSRAKTEKKFKENRVYER